MKKTPIKRGESKLKSKPLAKGIQKLKLGKRLVAKPKSPERKEEDRKSLEMQWEMFNKHWDSKKHECESCGCPLYGENLSVYHHHCLPKSKFPQYKYRIDNLILVCWECHNNIEGGKMTPEGYKKIKEIKKNVLENEK